MSKSKLYARLKLTWRDWDDEVYRLASSMVSAFRTVVDSTEADPSLVAQIRHIEAEARQYKARLPH